MIEFLSKNSNAEQRQRNIKRTLQNSVEAKMGRLTTDYSDQIDWSPTLKRPHMVGQHIHTIGWMPRIVAKHKQFTSPLILLPADPINSATIRNRRFLDVVRKRRTKQQDGRHGLLDYELRNRALRIAQMRALMRLTCRILPWHSKKDKTCIQ